MFHLSLLLLAPQAEAAPICGITAAEYADVTSYYGLDPSNPHLQAQVQGPFQCSEHGDLCLVLGPVAAEDYVCDLWSDMVAHLPEATVMSNAHARFEEGADGDVDWDDEFSGSGGSSSAMYAPDGFESDQIALFAASSFASSCPVKSNITIVGSHKQKTRAYYTYAIVYREIGGSSKGWNQTSSGGWSKANPGVVSIGASYSSSACASTSSSDADGDGFVNTHISAWGIGIAPALQEFVESTGTFAPIGAAPISGCAQRTALWTCP